MITQEEIALSRRLADAFFNSTIEELPPDARGPLVRAYQQFREFDRLPLHLRERIVALEALATARRSAGMQ